MHEHNHQLQHVQRTRAKRQSTACSLYGHPATGETVTAYEDFAITWDCACLGTSVKDIDITLYYYGGGALHAWTGVPCSDGSLTTQFKPTWWNSSLSANLQLQITESNQPVWATTTGLGPSFAAAWNGTTPSSVSNAGNGTQSGVSIESIRSDDDTGGIAGGKLAAAVTVPLLAAAIAVGAYIFYSRRKVKPDRKRWSAYVDQRYSQYSAAASPGGTGGRPSMQSRGQSVYSTTTTGAMGGAGSSPEKRNHSISALASRPDSNYSLGPEGNFAGVGSTVRMPPMAAQFPAMTADYDGQAATYHDRGYSVSGMSAVGPNGEARPASSYYALDGHSISDAAAVGAGAGGRAASMDVSRRGGGRGTQSISSRPNSQFRPQGTGTGDRISRVSFADSSFTSSNKEGGSHNNNGGNNRRSSYFANGPGTASSPNAHRYKSSQGNSVSGNSIFNMYGGGNGDKDTPAMPPIPIPAFFNKDRDVTKGVEATAARDISADDLAGILKTNSNTNAFNAQSSSPESFATAALPHSSSADSGMLSPFDDSAGVTNNQDYDVDTVTGTRPRKHTITISTSMPRLANPQGRQSILSPDDMLKAYATKSSIAGPNPRPMLQSSSSAAANMQSSASVPALYSQHQQHQQRPDTFMSDSSKYDENDKEEFAPATGNNADNNPEILSTSPSDASSSGMRGVFNTKFKFGSSK